MAVGFSNTNKPINPRGNDASPKGYNRASLYSGKALDFDGVNDLVTGSSSSLPANEYTIVSYFNLDTLKASGVVWWGTDAIGKRRAMLIWNGGSGSDWFLSADGYATNVKGSTPLETGKWYFGAVSVDSSNNAKVYLNAQEDGSGSLNLNAYTGTTYNVGKTDQSAEVLDGKISGARVFNQVLTPAQVADLYNNPEKVVPTGVDNTALKLWLPMQEGAGTTAYDGSGNGNHGTISGATYTHGIGAPVSQTAVIDWNKGTNYFTYSEDLENADWTKSGTTASDGETDALGTLRATELAEDNTNAQHVAISNSISLTSGTQYYISVLAKQGVGSRYLGFAGMGLAGASESPVFDLQNGSVDLGASSTIAKSATIEAYGSDGWYKCSMVLQANSTASLGFYFTLVSTATDNTVSGYNYQGDGTSSIFLFAPMFKVGSEAGVYTPTIATAQTSPVLLPQGLTTGRDITGVNLFENVRKQGALNLDGNSWAEVHDNESLDITSAITLEAWVYWNGSTAKGLLGRWKGAGSLKSYLLFANTTTAAQFLISNNGSANYAISTSTSISIGWNHIVGTADGSKVKIYLNGAFENEAAAAVSIYTTNLPVEIGRLSDGGNVFDDQIAQPRIYNRALTAAEVLQNYNSGKNTYK